MELIHTISQMRQWRNSQQSVVLVPTMGNLHEGHISLIKEAKKHANQIVVSIFVNRLQFGQGEDFSTYPRTLESDLQKLNQEVVDAVFLPDEKELYPHTVQNYNVEPPHLQYELCGKFRPGHFRGVATVVNKLFNIVTPQAACFGKKDYQQLHIIREMVNDLNIDIKIIPVDTGRSEDGLALSSRNQYLTVEERQLAPEIYLTLLKIADSLKDGDKNFLDLETQSINHLNQLGFQTQYLEIRRTNDLSKAQSDDVDLIILVAAQLGKTRLIDNVTVNLS